MLRNIQKLPSTLQARREMAARLAQAIDSVFIDVSHRFLASTANTAPSTTIGNLPYRYAPHQLHVIVYFPWALKLTQSVSDI